MILFIMDGCSICAKAKHHLNKQNVPYEEINILQTPDAQYELKELTGEVFTPVLVSDEGMYKGLEILECFNRNE